MRCSVELLLHVVWRECDGGGLGLAISEPVLFDEACVEEISRARVV